MIRFEDDAIALAHALRRTEHSVQWSVKLDRYCYLSDTGEEWEADEVTYFDLDTLDEAVDLLAEARIFV